LQEVVPIEAHHLWVGLGLIVGLKVLLSLMVAWLSLSPRGEGYEARVHGWMGRVPLPPSQTETTAWERVRRVLGDLLRPWFLFSLFLMGVFAFVSRPDQVNLVWFALRPLAVGF